jgi:hypothetical protein
LPFWFAFIFPFVRSYLFLICSRVESEPSHGDCYELWGTFGAEISGAAHEWALTEWSPPLKTDMAAENESGGEWGVAFGTAEARSIRHFAGVQQLSWQPEVVPQSFAACL